MAEFLEIARNWDRICAANGDTCLGCVLASKGDLNCRVSVSKKPDWFAETVMKWVAEHPQKTMLDVFYEKFPKAERLKNGALRICPHHLDPSWGGLCDDGETGDCRACWAREVPDDA